MFSGITIAFVVLLSCNQTDTTNTIEDTSYLYQHWIHSYEEDDSKQNYRVYRPATYSFPPTRGREGFEIKEKGIFIAHRIAPQDGNMSVEEKWSLSNDELIITGKERTDRYKIIELSKEKLVLKSLPPE